MSRRSVWPSVSSGWMSEESNRLSGFLVVQLTKLSIVPASTFRVLYVADVLASGPAFVSFLLPFCSRRGQNGPSLVHHSSPSPSANIFFYPKLSMVENLSSEPRNIRLRRNFSQTEPSSFVYPEIHWHVPEEGQPFENFAPTLPHPSLSLLHEQQFWRNFFPFRGVAGCVLLKIFTLKV